ncbi:MAG: hypothetical protein WBJ83_10605 [Thermacetogeniaceae bacterium]|jgi:hypothetical protein
MEYNVAKYPEGYEKVKNEELNFLPDDEDIRESFMTELLQWLIQW